MKKLGLNAFATHHWHLPVIAFGIGLLLFTVEPPSRATLQTHNFSDQCETCHLTSPASELPMLFTAPIDQLCERCHELNQSNSHPSGIQAIYPVDPAFPLDVGNLLTCASCHHPCQSGGEETYLLLRVPFDGVSFCLRCHQAEDVYTGRHVMAAGFVHAKKWTPPDPMHAGLLDPISSSCLACHDGSVNAPSIGVTETQAPDQLDISHASHPLALDFAQRAAENHELTPFDQLSGQISLYEGKVGCASCHSPFASRNKHLVMDNTGSMLCLECHIK